MKSVLRPVLISLFLFCHLSQATTKRNCRQDFGGSSRAEDLHFADSGVEVLQQGFPLTKTRRIYRLIQKADLDPRIYRIPLIGQGWSQDAWTMKAHEIPRVGSSPEFQALVRWTQSIAGEIRNRFGPGNQYKVETVAELRFGHQDADKLTFIYPEAGYAVAKVDLLGRGFRLRVSGETLEVSSTQPVLLAGEDRLKLAPLPSVPFILPSEDVEMFEIVIRFYIQPRTSTDNVAR